MDSIKCVFIAAEDVPLVVEFTRQNFLRDEPLCHSLNLADASGLDEYFRHAVEQGSSVMAIDTARDDAIVGIRAHRVVNRDDPKEEGRPPSDAKEDPCAPLLDLVDAAFLRYNPWKELDIDKLLYFKFLIVHPDYRGRNIAARMTEFTFDFMRREQIPVAFVLATSAYSQAVFKKTGFQVVDEIKYEDYKVDGKRVFQPAPIHTGCATFIKWV